MVKVRDTAILFLSAVISLVSVSAHARTKVKPQQITFQFEDEARQATLFIPPQEGPLPVIVLLHGSGRNGGVMVAEWKDLAAREGIILAAPNALNSMEWNLGGDPPELFHELVDKVRAIHPIDPSRIYLFGHSAGASYALVLAVADPDFYAAAAIHAGELPPTMMPSLSMPRRHMPVAIWVGDRDPNFPAAEVAETKRVMDANGYNVQLSVMAQHDHNYYAVSGTVNQHAWEFLKGCRLPQPGA